jgi:hypothetical protein
MQWKQFAEASRLGVNAANPVGDAYPIGIFNRKSQERQADDRTSKSRKDEGVQYCSASATRKWSLVLHSAPRP